MNSTKNLVRRNRRYAKARWGGLLGQDAFDALRSYSEQFQFSLATGDLLFLDTRWYVTYAGLTRLARRSHCAGIHVEPVAQFSDPAAPRWAFKATVYKSKTCKGFVGYGDADPSNTSSLVRGAEMRVAETRAVNRALRKAYGIGICSVEEIGSSVPSSAEKFPPQNVKGTTNGTGKGSGLKVRDRLYQLIRQHKLDAELVKAYCLHYCSTASLKDATREQIENFVRELAQWAEKDRAGLVCQLNSYLPRKEEKEGAA